MKFTVPDLGYSVGDLAPIISRETVELHYGGHLQAYLKNLNELVVDSGFEQRKLEDIVRSASGALYNNAAQVWNHVFYFDTFSPSARRHPVGALLHAIELFYGSFNEFKAEFERQGASIFGSGWVWLSRDAGDQLHITCESNAGNPLRSDLVPLLTFDVWEHAYYVDYRNRRAEHLATIWDILDWEKIEQRYLTMHD